MKNPWFIVGGWCLLCVLACLYGGCSAGSGAKKALQPPDRYLPSENFGNGGATRCGTVNCAKQWLKPCDN